MKLPLALCLIAVQSSMADSASNTAAIIDLLKNAQLTARSHGAKYTPVLSPLDTMVGSVGNRALFDIEAVKAAGFPIVIWTVNDPARMAELLGRHVDGIISDRPDLLHSEVMKLDAGYRAQFDAQAHRGGRDLRPENTLPSFESGLDNLVTTLETDTGVTKDGVSLISHEEFINPQTCRTADGTTYSTSNRVWIKDITMADAQRRFICDKVFRGPQQSNDLSLSPAAVAFARKHRLQSPYSPTFASQLFEFADFYVDFYRNGEGRNSAHALERWQNALKVRFNLETKLSPKGQTASPQKFVNALCGAISKAQLEVRADVQSFDFRTLKLAGEQFPKIRTVYLIESMRWQQR